MSETPAHAALIGPTASGKSSVALEIARQMPDFEIVSIDSMQVYRGMDIGTAKPSAAEQAEIPHHLIDLADPADGYAVSLFQQEYDRVLAEIEGRGHRALLVGGTGLYFQVVVDRMEMPGRYPETMAELETELDTRTLHGRLAELDPLGAGRMEPTNRRRVLRALEVTIGSGRPFSSYGPGVDAYPETNVALYGLRLPRPIIDARIDARYDGQLAAGFLDEVRMLAARPEGWAPAARQALGYRELLDHVENGTPLLVAMADARMRTRRFARRQERWFRRDPRITWLETEENPLARLDDLLRDLKR